MEFLDLQRVTYGDLSAAYEEFGQLYSKKLYHQLTLKLTAFVNDPNNFRGTNMLDLATQFISKFEIKLNQLQLVLILSKVCTQLTPTGSADELARAADFLQPYVEKRGRLGEEAYVVMLMQLASLRLRQDRPDDCKALLEEGKTALDAVDGADAAVFSHYHRAASEYYQRVGPPSSFYESAMLYLSYTPLDTLTAEEKAGLAQNVALAALLGEGLYNFGEVVQHPILEALDATPQAWLKELLSAFHHGDIDEFTRIVSDNADEWDAQDALRAYSAKVKQKVSLLCLMELASKRPASDRVVPFTDIAAETQLPLDEVEPLLMRAMALELVKGTIDEVDSVVQITYIKPRVLDPSQIAVLKERLDTWQARVGETLALLEQHTEELLT